MPGWLTLWGSSQQSRQCLNLPTTPAHRWPNSRTEAAKLPSSSIETHSRAPLLIAASVSTLGGLLFGYDNIVISGAIGYLTQLFHLDAACTGWAACCTLIGCIIGCAAAGICLRPACSSPPTAISSWPGA